MVNKSEDILALASPSPHPTKGGFSLAESRTVTEQGREVSDSKIPGASAEGSLMKDLRPSMGRYVVDATPGSYGLSIDPGGWDKRYAVKIEECGVTTPGEA